MLDFYPLSHGACVFTYHNLLGKKKKKRNVLHDAVILDRLFGKERAFLFLVVSLILHTTFDPRN